MKKINLLFKLITLLNFNVIFAQSSPFWQNKIEVTESTDGSIVSTSSASYASSAYSINSIPGNQDGYFEFTVNNLYGMVGLTSDPIGSGYANIDYCFQLWASTTLNIMENSVTVYSGTAGSWTKGDKLKIKKTGNVIRYYKNNVLLHTSTQLTSVAANYYADFAFGGANTGFDTPIIFTNTPVTPNYFWKEKTQVNESSDGTIVSTSDASYASSAYSIDSIPGNKDGYFEFTVNNLYGMVGLTSDPKGGGYATIDYCFQLWASTTLNIMENSVTVYSGTAGSWTKGDKLKIEKTGTVVKYYKNNVLLYTSTQAASTSSNYFGDFAFGGSNTGFDKPVIVSSNPVTPNYFWQSKIEVNESSDGTIVSTSDASYASSAYSINSIPGNKDGYFEFTVNNLYGMVGLTSDPSGTGFATIDYCFQLWASTTLNIMENSVTVWTGTAGSWTKGDKLKIEKTGAVIKYYKNNILLYTSAQAASTSANYYADFAFGGSNTGFDKPVLVATTPVTPKSFWQSKIEVNELTDGSIVSTSSNSYASSAYSVDSIPGNNDGYFEFTVNNLYGMVGLTSDPSGTGFATIDYCFQLWASTTLNIMENSRTVYSGTAGSWAKGDKLKIQKTGNVIKYYKNNVLLYTSTQLTSTSANYFADFAFGGANTGFDTPVIYVNNIVTSVEENQISNENLIYPNPTSNSFNIAEEFEGTVEIINLKGAIEKTILKKKGIQTVNLNLKSGVYLVNFINSNGKRTTKLEIE